MELLCPVLLCGGCGTRLWPLSRSMYPKQFMELSGHTLFGDTLERISSLQCTDQALIVCNENQRFLSAAILQQHGVAGKIILEPEGRNTAPAIALAAFIASNDGRDPLLLVLPTDHSISSLDSFTESVVSATQCAQDGFLVTFGVTPTHPETGFGYIRKGKPIESGFSVSRFEEKPSLDQAVSMLSEGEYLWNSGMFLFRASVYLEELKRYAPAIYDACHKAYSQREHDRDFLRVQAEIFKESPSVSIDYAVMEHSERSAVVPLSAAWSDLGSWAAFYEAASKDSDGNACIGDVVTEDTHGCYLHGTHRLVATLGVTDLTVVETADAVLVAHQSRSQDVKKIIEQLKATGRTEVETHMRVFRPWGSYEILINGDRFQVKRLEVKPGAVLSLQMHMHRSEHWVVVQGTAKVTSGEQVFMLKEDESTYIPLAVMHRLENPGRIPLVIVEIQTGAYLGEDDIIRLEDTYGRC